MKPALLVLAVATGLFALDRLALRAEARGWIYWRHSKRRGSSTGNALLDIGTVFDSGARHMVDVREAEPMEETSEDDLIKPQGETPQA